jgi:hypothetical protein
VAPSAVAAANSGIKRKTNNAQFIDAEDFPLSDQCRMESAG